MSADNARLKVLAPAKLNLTFEIGPTRPDGFHEIGSLFHAIDLCDSISFETQKAEQFAVTFNEPDEHPEDFPLDDSNLICKSAQSFVSRLSSKPNFALFVKIKKKIPIAAGMGGGSADAAATIFALNEICGEPFKLQELIEIASTVGADVPFCLLGGTALGEGKGEVLTAIPVFSPLHFLIVKPATISISTAWAYSTFDNLKSKTVSLNKSRRVAQLLKGKNSWQDVYDLLGNDFEEMIFEHHPLLRKAKDILLENGAVACHLTGKGPTLYAITSGAQESEQLSHSFLKHFEKDVKFDSWMARSLEHGVKAVES